MKPTLRVERRLWRQGLRLVAGVDEVGRGALAGPVVAAAVVFPQLWKRKLTGVKDSKEIPPGKRLVLADSIRAVALDWALGEASVSEIERGGIVRATQTAMRRAVKNLRRVEFVLIDAFYVPRIPGLRLAQQLAVRNGDGRCLSIAAASILAKVHRDQLLIKLSKRYPSYALDRHKGYGTLRHRQALRKFGPTPHHRTTFIKKFL